MKWTTCIVAMGLLVAAGFAAPSSGLIAIRATRAETVANGTMEHAVILIDDGKIVTIGEDLPIERGIPVVELPADWVVMPGLVNAYTRLGMDGAGYADSRPSVMASGELYAGARQYADALEAGVTTMGQYPAGNGIPGQAVALQPTGATPEEMILEDGVYLKIRLRSASSSKKMLRDGFKKADDWLEKEQKNREKWEKAQEKKKKKSKSKKKKDEEEEEDEKKKKGDDDEKGDEKAFGRDDEKKDEDEESDEYAPIDRDAKAQPFLDLRDGTLRAVIAIGKAGDYDHFIDAMGDEEFDWDLRIPLTRDSDIFHVKEKIAERGVRVVFEPSLTLHPGTMRQRNLAAEFARAGAKLVLIPRSDSVTNYKAWLRHTGEVIAAGLDRDVALRALTQEPAELLGLGDRIGTLEEGKDANLLFFRGDPFEPGSKLEAVMLDGDIVHGEVQ